MSRPATAKLKVNPPVGALPVLQYCQPEQLLIDVSYQRSLQTGPSQALIRRIAVHWDWGLCQPLFVARRADGGLYVVDGQHRLEAAKLRADIWQLPCVVSHFDSAVEEAAAFVALNQQRRPLTQLEIFKAALASGDFEASQIALALTDAGLALANNTNNQCMPPAHIANIGGLQACYRRHGVQVLTVALDVLARSFKGQVLRYAGSIFPGIAAIVADELDRHPDFAAGEMFALMIEVVGAVDQPTWFKDFAAANAEHTNLKRSQAAAQVMRAAWAECCEAMLDEAA